MKIVSLSSGSDGNAYCLNCNGSLLLVDCGISCRELSKRCENCGVDLSAVIGVVFTHNHRDHTKGIKTFHKKFPGVELFANMMTAEAIAEDYDMDTEDWIVFENNQSFGIGNFEINPFSISHDVPDPVGYFITSDDGDRYFHATDLGIATDTIGRYFSKARVATLESNHDPILLCQSNRPEDLKMRISGPRGHLSNDQAAEFIMKYAGENLQTIALAHLSEECNAPHLAINAAKDALKRIRREDVNLKYLLHDKPLPITGV